MKNHKFDIEDKKETIKKEIKSAFPDAILEKNGKEILVEFEFLSSNYIEHCHPDDKKYLCICWRKDIELKETSIFSLEEYIRNKNKTRKLRL